MNIGDYRPVVQKKGEQEAFIDGIKEGQTYWQVQLDEEHQFDTLRQEDAIIISLLTQILVTLENLGKVDEAIFGE